MNVDTQFLQAPIAPTPAQPPRSTKEQTTERPVERTLRDEATDNQAKPDTETRAPERSERSDQTNQQAAENQIQPNELDRTNPDRIGELLNVTS